MQRHIGLDFLRVLYATVKLSESWSIALFNLWILVDKADLVEKVVTLVYWANNPLCSKAIYTPEEQQ